MGWPGTRSAFHQNFTKSASNYPEGVVCLGRKGVKLRTVFSASHFGNLLPLVPNYDAILMANHGVVTYGQDLLMAFFRMETVEHFAKVALVTELLGKQVLLSSGDVEKLLAARARYGLVTAAPVGAECPVTSDTASGDRINVTREELEALIEEAVKKRF